MHDELEIRDFHTLVSEYAAENFENLSLAARFMGVSDQQLHDYIAFQGRPCAGILRFFNATIYTPPVVCTVRLSAPPELPPEKDGDVLNMQQLREILRAERADKKMTIQQFADHYGFSMSFIDAMLNTSRPIPEPLAEAMGYKRLSKRLFGEYLYEPLDLHSRQHEGVSDS